MPAGWPRCGSQAGAGKRSRTRTAVVPQAGARIAPVAVGRTADGRVSLQWDAAAHPMLLVRDGATGQIMSFARGGHIELPAATSQLSVAFSNRVQSGEVRVAVPAR